MPNYYQNPNIFDAEGYEYYFTRFSDSIIKDHFEEAQNEINIILSQFQILESQIIAPGGGLSSITQNLRDRLDHYNWKKENIESEHHVGGEILTSESHEVDHYKRFVQGNIGLEIEWNNKDPFFDRDLENFRKLHQIGELSIGIIITRGISLQAELLEVYTRFISQITPFTADNIIQALSPLSDSAKQKIRRHILEDTPDAAISKIARDQYSSKYGTATTHMDKLQRGVGNPCPLILIGIGKERLIADM